eukprot:TRINITY_DN3497_c0_g1_i1.p1 TRINITY_DN3497_c0_g1~~TRINITY_DN3497_c0_g1_i1.p1  ORF type:complete len:122 (-),score=6.12 TRINITY_DN3497_c0_g1_i1:324-689(-)
MSSFLLEERAFARFTGGVQAVIKDQTRRYFRAEIEAILWDLDNPLDHDRDDPWHEVAAQFGRPLENGQHRDDFSSNDSSNSSMSTYAESNASTGLLTSTGSLSSLWQSIVGFGIQRVRQQT